MDVIEIAQISGMIACLCIVLSSLLFDFFLDSLFANKNKNK